MPRKLGFWLVVSVWRHCTHLDKMEYSGRCSFALCRVCWFAYRHGLVYGRTCQSIAGGLWMGG
jgi:hypothetical protein